MHAHILTEFDPSAYRRFGIATAEHLLVLRVDPIYWDSLHKKLKTHVEKNDKRIMAGQEPFKLEVKINVDYRHRSLPANAWMWAMHTIEAAIINGKGEAWHDKTDVTPEMIHEDYMDRFAPRADVIVDEWMAGPLGETARIVSREDLGGDKIHLVLMKSSSYMNAKEFAQLSHEIERQMESYGISLDNYIDYKKLADQISEFDKEAEKTEDNWHRLTDAEKKAQDPKRFDEEKQLEIF